MLTFQNTLSVPKCQHIKLPRRKHTTSMGQMLRSRMKVAEMYPGKTSSIKCDNVLLEALITNTQNCKKSANMKG
jgi:hypothetical protein